MRFGVHIPNCTEGLIHPLEFASAQDNVRLAILAEQLGFASIWVNDHFTTQRYLHGSTPPNFYDPFVTLGAVSSVTEKVRLCIGIVVVPIRDPITLGKAASTLDSYSCGRVTLGVGAGAYRDEFECTRPDLASEKRGKILDEGIVALRSLLSEAKSTYAGKYFRFRDVQMYPKPVQKPLPIYIGGNAIECVKRAARLGEGWVPACISPEQLSALMAKLKAYAEVEKRDYSRIDIEPAFIASISKDDAAAHREFTESPVYRHLETLKESTLKDQSATPFEQGNIIGTPSHFIRRIQEYVDVGLKNMYLIFTAKRIKDLELSMKTFSDEVMPSFR